MLGTQTPTAFMTSTICESDGLTWTNRKKRADSIRPHIFDMKTISYKETDCVNGRVSRTSKESVKRKKRPKAECWQPVDLPAVRQHSAFGRMFLVPFRLIPRFVNRRFKYTSHARPILMGAVQNFCSKLPSRPFSVDIRPKRRLDGC